MYVIKEAATGVTTQGYTIEEAIANIKEAVGLYIKEVPDARKILTKIQTVSVR